MAASAPTPSSEIIHLVETFADTLDAIPPSLTRSLSDLKELDAVLSGSLRGIVSKLQKLDTLLHSATDAEGNPITPWERLSLLGEVAEDCRTFRLGGEDKIRVATATCESIATYTHHLSTLSSLLLSYLPSHLLPLLPPPSAPHGYPASITPSSAITRRQIFDYPSTHATPASRMQGALQIAGPLARGPSSNAAPVPKRAVPKVDLSGPPAPPLIGAPGSLSGTAAAGAGKHPNQYTKKKQLSASNSGIAGSPASGSTSTFGGIAGGMTAIDSVKEKRRTGGAAMPGSADARVGGDPSGSGKSTPVGAIERGQKRKGMADEGAPGKRRKKGEHSPDTTFSSRSMPTTASTKPRRPSTAGNFPADMDLGGTYDEMGRWVPAPEDEEPADEASYCYCGSGSWGEMIGCDGLDCAREWFHLECTGMDVPPSGMWYCDDCKKKNEKAPKPVKGRK